MIPHVEATTLTTAKKVAIPKRPGSAAFVHRFLLSKLLHIGVLLSICIIVPVTIYLIVFSRALGPMESFPVVPSGTCSHLSKYRIRCGENLSQGLCVGRGCCYSTDYGCYHFMPAKSQFVHRATPELDGSSERQTTATSGRALYALTSMSATSAYGFSLVPNLFCEINEISPSRLTIMVRNDPVTTSEREAAALRSDNTSSMYYYEVASPIFYISVHRRKDRKLLLSTHRGAFVVTLNYIEWSFYLGTEVLIGLGSLRLTPGSRTIVAVADYPNIPLIVAFDPDNQKYHGLYLSSPYPIEVEITEAYLIVLRGIYDNESFSVELIVADDLDSLQLELHKLIGYSDPRAAYYNNALQFGFHICDSESLFGGNYSKIAEDLEKYLDPELLGDIPYDSHCLTERVAALNRNMPDVYLPFFARFKENGKAVILNLVLRLRCSERDGIVDGDEYASTTPLEACDAMSNYDVLQRTSTASANSPYVTRIAGREYVYVDWASQPIMLSLDVILNETINSLKLGFDGIVLQGNWLQDDQLSIDPNPASDLFPYVPKDFLQIANGLVPPWKSQSRPDNGPSAVETIRTYNVYAGQSVRWVSEYLREQNQQGGGGGGSGGDMFLSSESSPYPHTNTILRGISGTWAALNATRLEILSNSLTGLHSINSNICGDEVPANYSAGAHFQQALCVRWYQFASLTSIFRALTTVFPHNFSKFYQKVLVRTIHARYSLSTYFLTMRRIKPSRAINTPLFYDYPELYDEDESGAANWMTVGLSLLAAPVITPTQQTLEVRLPEMSFEFNDGIRVPRNSSAVLSVILSDLPLFIKAGHIVAVNFVETSKTVIEARQEDLFLVIALLPLTPEATAGDGNEEFRSTAQGWLAIGDDKVIEITAAQNGTQVTVSSRNPAPGIVPGCSGETTQVSRSVRMIKWFGLWVDVVELPLSSSSSEVEAGDVDADSYRSLLCHLESSVDLCAEELSFSIDTVRLTETTNCAFI